MWLFPVIVTALVLPPLAILILYLLTLARRIDDPEIKARRRWRMISRGNAVWILAIIAGLIAVAEAPIPGFGSAARAVSSVLFIVISFCLFAVTLGVVDRKVRGVDNPLGGYLRLQLSLFFCRWSSFLIVVVFLYVVRAFTGEGRPLYVGIVPMIAGAAVFVVVTLYQMRLIGRATGFLTPIGPDRDPGRIVAELAPRAGVDGVRVSVMETFGYPFYNAFAAPGKTIYITRPVLSALSREEVAAIAAHEIGHLVTMRRRTAVILSLMTAAVVVLWFLIPRLARIVSDIGSFVVEIAAALIIMVIAILALAAVSRRYETRADATATELMGGADAVIGALEKIYALNMLPRRFDKKGSENASHPSLERRIAQLKGEELPRPKRRVAIPILIAISILILVCLRLLSCYGERFLETAGPRPSNEALIAALEARLAEDPADFEALKGLANEYFFDGEDGPALETIDCALAVKRDPGLLLLKGFILEWAGDTGGALNAAEEAIGAGGGPHALRWAAAFAVALGDTRKAGDYLSALRAIDPHDPYAETIDRYLSGDGDQFPYPDYSLVFQGTGR